MTLIAIAGALLLYTTINGVVGALISGMDGTFTLT